MQNLENEVVWQFLNDSTAIARRNCQRIDSLARLSFEEKLAPSIVSRLALNSVLIIFQL